MNDRDNSFLKQRGSYRNLLTFRKAETVYDITFHFAHRFLEKGDRTIDQMIQAARSGKQNIAEGSAAAVTSREMEIKLVNVAKASLQELLVDYEDYLRVRKLPQWQPGDEKFEQTRAYCSRHNDTTDFADKIPERSDSAIANIAIILINQIDFLLFRQIEYLKKSFLEQGGIKEEMTRARKAHRGY